MSEISHDDKFEILNIFLKSIQRLDLQVHKVSRIFKQWLRVCPLSFSWRFKLVDNLLPWLPRCRRTRLLWQPSFCRFMKEKKTIQKLWHDLWTHDFKDDSHRRLFFALACIRMDTDGVVRQSSSFAKKRRKKWPHKVPSNRMKCKVPPSASMIRTIPMPIGAVSYHWEVGGSTFPANEIKSRR